MECPNCKISILDHAKVCPFCQTRFDNGGINNANTESEANSDTDIKTKKHKNIIRFGGSSDNHNSKSEKRIFGDSKNKGKLKNKKTKPVVKEEKYDKSKAESLFNSDDFDISYTLDSIEKAEFINNVISGSSLPREELRSEEKETVKTVKRKRKKRISNKVRRCIFFSIVTVLLCTIVFWCCNSLYRFINNNKDKSVFMYLKGNELYAGTEKNSTVLTENLIDAQAYKNFRTYNELSSVPEASETINQPELSSDEIIEIYNSGNFAVQSENNRFIYFLSGFDVSVNSGQLKCFNLKDNKVTDIADNVNDSFKVSKDGKSVLFLRNSDYSGNVGELCFWKVNGSVLSISEDIDKNMYVFSQDKGKVLFLRNFNHSLVTGDLCEYNLKAGNSEPVKIDTDVCRIFGTDKSGKIYIYAKDYNAALGCFDIYTKEKNKDRRKLIEQSALPPIISEGSAECYMYGGIENNLHNIYLVNVENGEKQKIASGITDIVKISDDERSMIYRKVYNGKTSDYYIYTKNSKETNKIASDVVIIPQDSKFSGVEQISVSDDFSCISYISSFDVEKGKGILYKTKYINNTVKESEKIADEAILCHTSADGKHIIYAKNYSLTRDVADIYINDGAETACLKEEIDFKLFEIFKKGDTIICISNYNSVGEYGTLEEVKANAEPLKISDDVAAFYIIDNSSVAMLKNYDTETKTFDIFTANKNGQVSKTDSGVTYIIG